MQFDGALSFAECGLWEHGEIQISDNRGIEEIELAIAFEAVLGRDLPALLEELLQITSYRAAGCCSLTLARLGLEQALMPRW